MNACLYASPPAPHRPWPGLLRGLCGVIIMLLCTAWAVPGVAQSPTHFTECTIQTGNNATVIVPTTASIVMDQDAISVGDEIAVFTPAGHCAGVATWTGSNIALTVWGVGAYTADGEALEAGEPMIFRVWDASSGQEFGGESSFTIAFSDRRSYLTTETHFVPDGIYVVDTLQLAPSPQAWR